MCPLPWRIISSDWVVDFDFPPWWCCPQLEAAIVIPWILGHTLISPVLSIVPPCLFFFFFPPMAQMARFRVSCLREWGATALVKEPEAELIIVITASYVYDTSQAEGAQGQLLHCRAAASLETPEQGLESGICLHQSGPPQMQGGRRLCCWRWASARLPESLHSDSSQAQQVHASLKLCVNTVFSHPCVTDVLQQQTVASDLLLSQTFHQKSLILMRARGSRGSYSHFKDKENKAQRNEIIWLVSYS